MALGYGAALGFSGWALLRESGPRRSGSVQVGASPGGAVILGTW